ncbi:MAG: daunorubicin resistance protein DrrA family ABC transporter ATP-binding protein [Ardenticatenaceae bacterium]|nr:MAG: daunorubicin resistance protein DrrA family ABC transporter ATP-binding protein [Ardenticatenaceae bacterium]
MKKIIEVTNLSKTYQSGGKAVTAVSNITFSVGKGELFGLFGPNGAGKSTIVRMLTTLLAPTEGTAVVNGFDVVEQEMQVRGSIGLVTADERSFYGRLTVRQNLQFYAAMQNIPRTQINQRIGDVLALFGLSQKADAATQSLSTGQKQRLNIARALIHNPPILFLDEPTKSMDVQTSDFVKQLIREELVNRQGKTVVFISHELYEMENFCDRVIILANGTVQAVGTPAELGAKLPRRALFRLVVGGNPDGLTRSWQALDGVESVTEISRGARQTTFDIALADERVWFGVLEVIEGENGRLESYHRADDESLRRIVAHFSQE